MTRTYFCRSSNYYIAAIKPRNYLDDVTKTVKQLGGKNVQFSPASNPKFGEFRTNDPELIEYMDGLMQQPHSDIFDRAEYDRQSTPAEVRANALTREVESNNRLINELKARLEAFEGKPVELPEPEVVPEPEPEPRIKQRRPSIRFDNQGQ